MNTQELLTEIRGLIAGSNQDGIVSLADRVNPSEWAAVVPQLDPAEVAVLLQ
jgi:hypothetical protein